jgi:hypothetical protein
MTQATTLKTFRVEVPFRETVYGVEFYTVEATTEEEALELIKNGDAYAEDMENSHTDHYTPFYDDVTIEETA